MAHFNPPRHARLVPGNPVIKVSGVSRYPFSLDPRPPYLVVLAILVCVQAFYSNHLFDSSIRRGQALR